MLSLSVCRMLYNYSVCCLLTHRVNFPTDQMWTDCLFVNHKTIQQNEILFFSTTGYKMRKHQDKNVKTV